MFSLLSLLTMAIGICTLLLIIPAISAAIARQADLETNKLQLARCLATSRLAFTQIELLENELKAIRKNYLEEQQKIEQLLAEKAALHQEGLRLHEELQQQRVELSEEFRSATFEQLQTLLTNYPSIHQMVQIKPELPAKNLLSMFTSLDNLLNKWGYEQIGKPWEKVAYNAQIHQPDTADIAENELVYIRFVGYQHQGKILVPAKVSRTLPGGGQTIKN
ncbi:nucleotide exchange factor GrpE [Nostoc sp. 'Peltigera malacea cyanobiont' DB3992]|uniref:nucleotide exchange factor GrpE n=1 Tax=Nostoc sp. 'Peltigera malacea cyanobiont' DB3992 TaxID=1206980 RepID=UPI0015D4BBE7|nr:molecular chaperone GrpE [Nostoc sp. 'Peltigera malacea cyanobiont' DB3992]